MEAMENSDKYHVSCFLISELYSIYNLIDKIELVILQRAKWSFELESFILVLKKNHIKVIYDIDDLIYHTKYVPKYLNSIGDYREFSIDSFFSLAKRYEMIASISDGYIVTTNALEQHIKNDFHKPVCVLPNFLNREQEEVSEKVISLKEKNYNQEKFVIGYFSGSNSHQRDLEIVESAVIHLMEKYDNIYLKIVGFMNLSDEFKKWQKKGRIIFDKFVPYEELQYKIGSVDVNIIPLQNHEFNQCKSELKYFEASIVDVVTCATKNDVYASIIEDGVDGYLCGEIDWFEKLEYIYLHQHEQKEIIFRAKEKCYQLYGNENQKSKITSIYDDIIESIGD
jgi:glycosyltransferase involved in cell wall biosynthesis